MAFPILLQMAIAVSCIPALLILSGYIKYYFGGSLKNVPGPPAESFIKGHTAHHCYLLILNISQETLVNSFLPTASSITRRSGLVTEESLPLEDSLG